MKKTVVLLLVMIVALFPCLCLAVEDLETEEPKTEEQPVLPMANARTGFGIGIPYGMVGINIEALPND